MSNATISIEWSLTVQSGALRGMCTVPIHRQVFHKYQPPKAGSMETYQENLERDTVLIHQRCFPVSLPVAAVPSEARLSSTPCNENGSLSVLHNSSSGEGVSKDCAPALVRLDNEHPQLDVVIGRDITSESEDCSPGPVQVPPRRETKLRRVDSTVSRYIYESDKPLLRPPNGLHPLVGDLFIQKHSNGNVNIWLWNDARWLSDISDGHVHPHT
ncbi:hypothetical protein F5141DRAFT_1219995 [Pisolithus sp. B1]|nr:hypothetical protein F5141DRAFT_1219995 [Pisolithus sp. B1]